MKKYILILLLLGILINSPVFSESTNEKRMTHKAGILYYFKTNGINPTADEYLGYAQDYYQDTYKKYHNDEFEWRGQFNRIKTELNDSIKNYQDVGYIFLANASLGQYDFDKEGFEYIFGDGSYFQFDSNQEIKWHN